MVNDIENRLKYREIADVADAAVKMLDCNRSYKSKIAFFHFLGSIAILLMPISNPNFPESAYHLLPPILIFGLTVTLLSLCFFASVSDLRSYAYMRSVVRSGRQDDVEKQNAYRGFLNIVKNMSSGFYLKVDTLVFPAAIGFTGTLSGMTAAWVYCGPRVVWYVAIGFLVLDYVAYRAFNGRLNHIIYSLEKKD